jgi:uncharacterized integral membrane protein
MSDVSPRNEQTPTQAPMAIDTQNTATTSPSPNSSQPNVEHHKGVSPTRASATWTAVVAAVVVLILLVVFIAQNTQKARVNFLWFHGEAPTSVVLLIAAIAGAVIVIGVGVVRILQLRHVARRAEPTT